MEGHNLSLCVQKKFREVPWDLSCLSSRAIIQFRVLPQISIHLHGLWPVDVALSEERKFRASFLSGEFLDLLVGAGLMVHELVSGECQDLEALAPIALVQLHKLFIGLSGDPSHRGHVDHHYASLALGDLAQPC